jgi:hypothetical protein
VRRSLNKSKESDRNALSHLDCEVQLPTHAIIQEALKKRKSKTTPLKSNVISGFI